MLGKLHDEVVSDQIDQWLQQQFLRNKNQHLNFELRHVAEHSIDRSHLGQKFQHVQDCNNSHIIITERKPVDIISLDHIEQQCVQVGSSYHPILYSESSQFVTLPGHTLP